VDVTAHRGYSRAAPENTVSAVKAAIDIGADFAEIDVQLTADNEVVIAHDADLMRLTGRPTVIGRTSYADLKNIDVGTSFSPEFAGEGIPTLTRVIEAAHGHIQLNVDIKDYAGKGRLLVSKVLDILDDHGMRDHSILMSVKYKDVKTVRELDPDAVVGFTPAAALGDISKLNVDFLAVSSSLATNHLIAAAHAQNKEVHVWTLDSPVDMSMMIDRGVDNIITNDPAAALNLLKERARLSDIERILLRFRNIYMP
jgi:glycerophosphoryl diester phosphodiesterase